MEQRGLSVIVGVIHAQAVVCGAGLLLAATVAIAQSSSKPYRIGWLGSTTLAPSADSGAKDFDQGLRDLKYVDGQNIVVVYRTAGGNLDKLGDLSADLIRQRVDVIVTSGVPAAFAAKRSTNSIPIVVTEFGLDPVQTRLVESLPRPGANVTGLATISEELWPKRLGLLKEIVPRVARLVVLWNPTNPGNASCLQEISIAAPAMGVRAIPLEVSDVKSLDAALAKVSAETADAIAICWDSVTLTLAKTIGDLALKQRLPTVTPLREYVDAGALISYGASLAAHRRRAAYYVDRILKGSSPASLPVERPTNFEMVVNLKTAQILGVALPAPLVMLADDSIR
jgi:putative tryptophan/tyrosine transport system substrate-binding protein